MSKWLSIGEIVKSVSITHKFDKPKLKFLNTADAEKGKIVNYTKLPISELKGQAKKTIQKDDILFSEVRPKNKHYAYVDIEDCSDYVASTKLMVLRKFNDDVDNKYFYYSLINDKMLDILQSRAENRICSFPQITFDLLSEYKIRIPEISEQKSIAHILEIIDKKIELNNKINSELERIAKTLYEYWFVQFDFPDEFGRPYKSSGGKMVYNNILKREIPLSWNVNTIEQIEDNIITGKTPKTACSEYYNGSIPFITIDDIRKNTYITQTSNTLTDIGAETQKGKYLPPNSLCISCIATVGLVGITTKLSQTNQQINSIICKKNNNLYFLYFAIKDYFKYSFGAKTGNTFDNMNKNDFSNILLYYPNEKILNRFYDKVTPIFNEIKSLTLETQELECLRNFILPMLLNGQITIQH